MSPEVVLLAGHSVVGIAVGCTIGDPVLSSSIPYPESFPCPISQSMGITHLGDAFPAMGVFGTKTGAARFADKVEGPFDGGTEADLVKHQQSFQLPDMLTRRRMGLTDPLFETAWCHLPVQSRRTNKVSCLRLSQIGPSKHTAG